MQGSSQVSSGMGRVEVIIGLIRSTEGGWSCLYYYSVGKFTSFILLLVGFQATQLHELSAVNTSVCHIINLTFIPSMHLGVCPAGAFSISRSAIHYLCPGNALCFKT